MRDRAASYAEGTRESSRPADLLDGGSFGVPGTGNKVLHALNVETSSTFCKPCRCDLLNMQERSVSASFQPMSDTYDKKAVGERLALLRRSQGYKLRPFARFLEIDHTKLNHWEKGKHYPDFPFMADLSRRYGVTADWLLFGAIRGLPVELLEQIRAAERLAAEPEEENAPASQTS